MAIQNLQQLHQRQGRLGFAVLIARQMIVNSKEREPKDLPDLNRYRTVLYARGK